MALGTSCSPRLKQGAGICAVTAYAKVKPVWAGGLEGVALWVSEFPSQGGRGGLAYSVCWVESFTPVLGFVRVWVPVKAK